MTPATTATCSTCPTDHPGAAHGSAGWLELDPAGHVRRANAAFARSLGARPVR